MWEMWECGTSVQPAFSEHGEKGLSTLVTFSEHGE